jgi:non-homologous end joining protein Ku
VLSKRERVIALEPYDKGLLGTTLRYPYEVRKAEDYFCDLPVNLMEALRRSVAEDTKGAAPRKGASATPARKRA